MTLYNGASIDATGTGQSTDAAAITYWRNTLGLPCMCAKLFIGPGQVGVYPTTIGTHDQAFINANVAFIPMFRPTYPVVTSEIAKLEASVSMWRNAGGVIPFVCLYNEVSSGNTLTAAEYTDLVTQFQPLRSHGIPIWVNMSGSHPVNGPSYWTASLHDGLSIDFYTSSYNGGTRIDWANTLAVNAGLPFGLLELGNDNSITDAPPFPAFMSYLTNLFQIRANKGQPIGPVMWWEQSGPGTGDAWITPATGGANDPRIPYINLLFNAVASGQSQQNGSASPAGAGKTVATPAVTLREKATLAGAGVTHTASQTRTSVTLVSLTSITTPAIANQANAQISGAGSISAGVSSANTVTANPMNSQAFLIASALPVIAGGAQAESDGAVQANAVLYNTALASGAGAVADTSQIGSTAALAGTGAQANSCTASSSAVIAGAGVLADNFSQFPIEQLNGAGNVTAVAKLFITAQPAGAGNVAGSATLKSSAALPGAGVVAPAFQLQSYAQMAGAGSVTTFWYMQVFASLAGAGLVSDLASQEAIAQLSGAGVVSEVFIAKLIASLSGTGQVSASTRVNGSAVLVASTSANTPATTVYVVSLLNAVTAGTPDGALMGLAHIFYGQGNVSASPMVEVG